MKNLQITVRAEKLSTTMEIVERNYNLIESFIKSGGNLGYGKNVTVETLEDYVALLKEGKIKYFNPEIQKPSPMIVIEDDIKKYSELLAYCIEEKIDCPVFTMTIYGGSVPVLMVTSGQNDYDKAKHYCIDHDIRFSPGIF